MTKRIITGAHISDAQCQHLIELFCNDELNAAQVAGVLGISRVTVNNYFNYFRKIIHHHYGHQIEVQTWIALTTHPIIKVDVLAENFSLQGDLCMDAYINLENWQLINNKQHKSVKLFWNYFMQRKQKFRGVHFEKALLHVNETVFRYNHPNGMNEQFYSIFTSHNQ